MRGYRLGFWAEGFYGREMVGFGGLEVMGGMGVSQYTLGFYVLYEFDFGVLGDCLSLGILGLERGKDSVQEELITFSVITRLRNGV